MTAAVVIVAILAVWNPSIHQGAEPEIARSLGSVAELYRSGDRDTAVATAGLWTQAELEAETQRLLEILEAPASAGQDTVQAATQRATTLSAAVVLMSDAAVRALKQVDPRRARWELHAAARLAHAMHSTSDSAAFTARFYLVSGLMLHFMGDLAGAYETLAEGRRRAGEDAELLLGLGAVIESVAALRTYDLPEARPRPRGSRDEPQFVIEGEEGAGGPLPHTDLADAQAALTKALRRDPSLLEAHLRLGRVLLLRGKPREALSELERVGRESSDPGQCYMAKLLEGRTRERLGDSHGAATAFADAVEKVPRGQSALLALGRALDGLGEAGRAQRAYDRSLQAEVERDPWLEYVRGQPDRIDTLVEELRRLVP